MRVRRCLVGDIFTGPYAGLIIFDEEFIRRLENGYQMEKHEFMSQDIGQLMTVEFIQSTDIVTWSRPCSHITILRITNWPKMHSKTKSCRFRIGRMAKMMKRKKMRNSL